METTEQITQALLDLAGGERSAADRLLPLIYDELRELASRYMANERSSHTLQATALVHEAYLRLIDQSRIDWKSRAHFFGAAAGTIRRILVDHAREHGAVKRGGHGQRISLLEAMGSSEARDIDLLALDEALEELNRLNARQRQVVELRFFGGLTVDEAAHVLEVSPQTVRMDWYMARAWLHQRLDR